MTLPSPAVLALGLAVAVPAAALAHHSFAMFDRTRTETVSGTVKSFEMINPHGWLRILVSGADGRSAEWSFETVGPPQLQRMGWTSTTVAVGDRVSVAAHPVRDGSFSGQLVSVTLADGRTLQAGRP